MARQFASCYDTPSTPEDRAKVRVAALKRATQLRLLAAELDGISYWGLRYGFYDVLTQTASELRQLAQGSDETVLDIIREKLAGGAVE